MALALLQGPVTFTIALQKDAQPRHHGVLPPLRGLRALPPLRARTVSHTKNCCSKLSYNAGPEGLRALPPLRARTVSHTKNCCSKLSYNAAPEGLDVEIRRVFEDWCKEYGRTYPSAEEREHRFEVFKKSYEFVQQHNAQGKYSYTVGLNEFSDLTAEEFEDTYLLPPSCCPLLFMRFSGGLSQE